MTAAVEIDTVMQAIISALEQSPETTLIYNADDPFCSFIASHVKRTITFGIGEDLHLPQDRVTGGRFCLKCGTLMEYDYHQYGQLVLFIVRSVILGGHRLTLQQCTLHLQMAFHFQ